MFSVRLLWILGLSLIFTSSPAIAMDSPHADKILIEKSIHTMTLFNQGVVIKTYKISLGPHIKGPKTQQGDGKTPEGSYVISSRNMQSGYHRALQISYPNAEDVARAGKLGIDPGGNIMIHGMRNGLGWLGKAHLLRDWTAGCIAVTDEEIEEIWNLVPIGTPVEIRP